LEASDLISAKNDFRESLNRLMEVSEVDNDIADLTNRLDDLTDKVEDDIGRVGYIRQLTAEFLDYLETLNGELKSQVEIPLSTEKMDKIMGRTERKRYYMSKFRL